MPGDLGVWRRDTHAADKMRMHTHALACEVEQTVVEEFSTASFDHEGAMSFVFI